LKRYCRNVVKAAGIPCDDDASNGGFVGVPNDCMAFDFAECWNTKKSMSMQYPPPGYSVEEDGEWEGRKLVPLVALAGDSLLEPFWPLGLGLKRGWQAIMDTCYAVDNIFNRLLLCERKGGDPEEFSWDEHYEALQEQCQLNFDLCNRLQVSEDLGRGEYDDKGVVVTQLKKMYKDAEKPTFEVEIDPWSRYGPLEKENGEAWKSMSKAEQQNWVHPRVKKAIAMDTYYRENSKGGKNGEISYVGKQLVSILGRPLASSKPKTAKDKKPAAAPAKKKPAAAPKAKK